MGLGRLTKNWHATIIIFPLRETLCILGADSARILVFLQYSSMCLDISVNWEIDILERICHLYSLSNPSAMFYQYDEMG